MSTFKNFFNHDEVIIVKVVVKLSPSGTFQNVFQNFLQPWLNNSRQSSSKISPSVTCIFGGGFHPSSFWNLIGDFFSGGMFAIFGSLSVSLLISGDPHLPLKTLLKDAHFYSISNNHKYALMPLAIYFESTMRLKTILIFVSAPFSRFLSPPYVFVWFMYQTTSIVY